MRAGAPSVKRAEKWRCLRWHVSVERMKWLFALLVVLGFAFAARFVPPRTAARLAARGLRAGWDWVWSIGDEARGPAIRGPPRHLSRKAQAAAPLTEAGSRRTASREGIVPQPPKETLHPDDRAALDSLLAEPPARAGYR
jgi:hypothetical protein